MKWGTVAEWLVAVGTLVLAAVAVFQDTIRAWFYRPKFDVSAKTAPPDCVAVPLATPNGVVVANTIYLRIWVENTGTATARNVEVYAAELRRRRADQGWERVQAFPPMNLKWANLVGGIYFPSISPGMGKHCDVAHIVDPPRRAAVGEENPRLGIAVDATSLAFDLMVAPNHKGHIVGPGEYELDILVAAENATPVRCTVQIALRGQWYPDEERMLRDGVGISVTGGTP